MICVHAHPSEIEKMGAPALSHLVIAQMTRIEQLEFQIAKLKREQFGPKSEKLPVNEAQLTLCLSGSVIEAQPIAQTEPPEASKEKPVRAARKSRALPAHLRREVCISRIDMNMRGFSNGVGTMLDYPKALAHRRIWRLKPGIDIAICLSSNM